jgi:hypothetical protein
MFNSTVVLKYEKQLSPISLLDTTPLLLSEEMKAMKLVTMIASRRVVATPFSQPQRSFARVASPFMRKKAVSGSSKEGIMVAPTITENATKVVPEEVINEDIWAWVPPKDRVDPNAEHLSNTYKFEIKNKSVTFFLHFSLRI